VLVFIDDAVVQRPQQLMLRFGCRRNCYRDEPGEILISRATTTFGDCITDRLHGSLKLVGKTTALLSDARIVLDHSSREASPLLIDEQLFEVGHARECNYLGVRRHRFVARVDVSSRRDSGLAWTQRGEGSIS
jgi:hypothetical protein